MKLNFRSRPYQLMSWVGLVLAALFLAPCVARANRTPMPYKTPQEKAAFEKRARQFGQLWLNRRRRKATQPVLRLLAQEPTPQLRQAMVVALGRLEDPQAAKPLRALLARVQATGTGSNGFPLRAAWRDTIAVHRIKLALGRIEARGLQGERKLNRIASAIGTTWPRLRESGRRWRSRLESERMARYKLKDDPSNAIFDEFHDVLYRMGKRGENIRALGGFDLVLWPQHQPILSTASLSDEAEIRFWLARAMPPSQVGFFPERLVDLGPKVPTYLLQALRTSLATAQKNPAAVAGRNIVGLKAMFDAAAATQDKRFVPVLQAFQKVNDQWVRNFAQDALRRLQAGTGIAGVAFP